MKFKAKNNEVINEMPDRNMIFHPAFIMHQLILPLMFDIGFLSSFVVYLIWLVNQCVYCRAAARCSKVL